jgi:hypothetical protein
MHALTPRGVNLPSANTWSLRLPMLNLKSFRFLGHRTSPCGVAALVWLLVFSPAALRALVISEVGYHSQALVDRDDEFVELYNENLDPLDLSGFTLCNGVQFTFPRGTFLDGRSFLVVCANEANIQARYGITNTIGDWIGSLANEGERIEVCNPGGITVVEVRYNDRGKWPSGADGTGHTLSLISPFLEVDDPDNWILSDDLDGTPGEANNSNFRTDGAVPSQSGLDAAGFITNWLLLGPYTGSMCSLGATALRADWLTEGAGGVQQTDLLWEEGQEVNTNYAVARSDALHANAGTARPTVREYTGFSDTINLNDAVWPPNPEFVMAYAFVYVDNVTAAPLSVDVAVASDDAIAVLINGTHVHVNDACRGVGSEGTVQDRAPATLAVGKNLVVVKVFEHGGGWSFRLRFETRGTTTPITSKARIQVTTDHTLGLNFGGGGTPIEPPVEDPPPPPPGPGPQASPLVINEGLFFTSGPRWVEVYNRTTSAIDLSGYHLTDDPANLLKATIPNGTSIPARSWRSFTDAELGLNFAVPAAGTRVFVALVAPAGDRVIDAFNFEPEFAEFSEARVPDGDSEFEGASDPTRDAANSFSANQDVVINEVMYKPIDLEAGKEFVELYNRGSQTVDIGAWEFTEGINFAIPDGTSMAPGSFLVIARDPALVRRIYSLGPSEVIGPEQTTDALAAFGRLRDGGERITLKDEMGRTADTVRYHDGGEWPRWADGHGSSMELIDPNQDNRFGQAWDSSDDSSKAQMQTYSYTGRHGGGESELAVLLLSRGITVVDSVSILNGATEMVTNGHFNSNSSGWIIEGTHIRSGRTTIDPINGAGSLKVIASGRGDNKVNRLETPQSNGVGLTTLPVGRDLAISFQARWVVGSQTLLTHGYEHAMAKAHALQVPPNLGTPGRPNSVTGRLIDRTGSANLGPVITDVSHSPAVPGASEAVTVLARVSDADGVSTVTLRYSLNNPVASPSSVNMTHQGGGIYRGTIPGQALGAKVVFFITATDTRSRSGRYPEDITTRTHPLLLNPASAGLNDHRYCIYRHEVRSPSTPYHSYRFFMTDADETELSNRRLLSNDLVDGSFVYGGERVYYESHTRFSGSPFARAGWGGSFRVALPRDEPLHGWIRKFNLDDHHGGPTNARERISQYLIRQNQGAISVPYAEVQILARWQVNDRIAATREHVWVPDADYISLWFPGDDDGDFFEMDDRFVIDDNGGRVGNADARLLYPPPSSRSDGNGANKENYRWFLGRRSEEGADDFTSLIEFARLMDPAATASGSAFDAAIFGAANVEEMLRIWAVRLNTDDWDQWGASRGKNCYLYRPDGDGRYHLLAWDLELTYGNVDSFLIPPSPTDTYNPGGFAEVNRFFNRTRIKRMYYGILSEMVTGPERWFHSDYLETYMQKLAAIGMSNVQVGLPGGFIDQRASRLATRIAGVLAPAVAFRITTNSGADFSTAAYNVDILGTAPANVDRILVNAEDYGVTYTSLTAWRIDDIPLPSGRNLLTFLAFDLRGDMVASATIAVTNTSPQWNQPQIKLLNPNSTFSGQTIEVHGGDFHNGVRVYFGDVESSSVTYSEFGPRPGVIVARVPAGSGEAPVKVRNIDGQESGELTFTYVPPPAMFLRADVNGDALVDISDAVTTLFYLFAGRLIDCEDAADADDNEVVDVTDAVFLLDFLFRRGRAPFPPYPTPGADPAGTALGCER